MKLAIYIIFGLVFYNNTIYGYQRSDAFMVTIHSSKISVVAPQKYEPRVNVIIENKMLIHQLGRIVTADNKVLSYISVEAGKPQSVEIGAKLKEKIYFVPMAPGFQKVELKIGSRPYEIPPQE